MTLLLCAVSQKDLTQGLFARAPERAYCAGRNLLAAQRLHLYSIFPASSFGEHHFLSSVVATYPAGPCTLQVLLPRMPDRRQADVEMFLYGQNVRLQCIVLVVVQGDPPLPTRLGAAHS